MAGKSRNAESALSVIDDLLDSHDSEWLQPFVIPHCSKSVQAMRQNRFDSQLSSAIDVLVWHEDRIADLVNAEDSPTGFLKYHKQLEALHRARREFEQFVPRS